MWILATRQDFIPAACVCYVRVWVRVCRGISFVLFLHHKWKDKYWARYPKICSRPYLFININININIYIYVVASSAISHGSTLTRVDRCSVREFSISSFSFYCTQLRVCNKHDIDHGQKLCPSTPANSFKQPTTCYL